jgi:signal transduction histidine kinase
LLVGLRVLERAPTLEAVREGLSGLRELTLGALEDVRRVALDLRPPALDDLGLVSALQVHLDGIAAAGGPEVVLTTDGPDARLSPEAELALYRVAQEALTNALRHARASRVQVNLHVEATGILLEVADDGVGFDRNDARAPGLGLAGMRERMNLISGTLEVDSMPGRGTIVTARVGPGPQA